jgi:hypothetical protein
VLTDSPVVRAAGPRILFMVGAALTTGILLWMHSLRLGGPVPGLTPIFYALFAFEDYGATICDLLILGAAVFLAARVPASRVLRAAGEHPRTIAALAAVVLCVGALFVYHDHPLSMDEYAAYFQSRVFAAGHLTGQFPLPQKDWLIPPGFQNLSLTISPATGQVTGSDGPGYALILAPFSALGIPWACNPILSALTLLIIHRLATSMFAEVEAAGLALLLTVCSPVFFGLGISYYAMPAELLANSLYALLLARPDPRRALAAGFVGSIAVCLHSPVPHLLFAVPWLIWIATRRGGVRLLALMCLGYLPLCLLLGFLWRELIQHLHTADLLKSMLSNFSPPTATVLLARVIGVAKVWVWGVPGLLILAVCGATRWRRNPPCMLLAASAAITLVGYAFFPRDQGHGWGYLYFHSAWMALPLLATAALFRPVDPNRAKPDAGAATARIFAEQETQAYVTACILLALVFGVGQRVVQMQSFMAYDLHQLPHYTGAERRVVILDLNLMFDGENLVQNDPWLRNSEIRMMSHGRAEDRQLMARYYPDMHRVFADHLASVWSAKGADYDAVKH